MPETPTDNRDLNDLASADEPGRWRVRLLLFLAFCVIALTAVEGVNVWPRLPDRIPTHFGPGGQPDAWSNKGAFAVYGILAMATGMLALFSFICSRLCSPALYNFPGKERMLKLGRAQQDYVIAPLREGLAWMGSGVTIALSLLERQSWEVALQARQGISLWPIPIAITVGFTAIIIGIVHANRRARELSEAA
jgi:polyferredoxin